MMNGRRRVLIALLLLLIQSDGNSAFLVSPSDAGRSGCSASSSDRIPTSNNNNKIAAALGAQLNSSSSTRHSLHADDTDNEHDDSSTLSSSRRSFLTTVSSFLLAATTLPSSSTPASAAATAATTQPSASQTGAKAKPKPATSPSSQSQQSSLEESISGIISGATLTLTKTFVKYPLDTATVRLQMPNSPYSIFYPIELLNGSYRGILPPLLWNIPAGAVFFGVKDAMKPILANSDLTSSQPKWIRTSLAVLIAQFPYWVVRNPSEVVKTKQQAGIEGYGDGVSSFEAYKNVLLEAGSNATSSNTNGTSASTSVSSIIQSFYAGYYENILYAFPADVLKFICYDWITTSLASAAAAGGGGGSPKNNREIISPLEGAVAGAASTAIAQFITTPLDVVRNRVMMSKKQAQQPDIHNNNSRSSRENNSYIETLRQLAQQEGLKGMFAGASPRIGKALLSGAIQFATYEETKQEISKLFTPTLTK